MNLLLPEDWFQLPLIRDVFEKVGQANVFTTLDITQAFHRLPIHEPDQIKTSFPPVDGKSYMFIGCPFGIKTTSSKFQRVMNVLFNDLTYVTTFVDDIVIFSRNLDEHEKHVITVIERLTKVNLVLNPRKCFIGMRSIYLLGFCISEGGRTSLDPRKVANVQDWPTPKTGKDIERFLGIINYFRNHIPNASSLTAPLDRLRKGSDLKAVWTKELQAAFDRLKEALQRSPVLHQPDMSQPFCVATDASSSGIGAMLYQVRNGKKCYIAFMARSLTKAEKNYWQLSLLSIGSISIYGVTSLLYIRITKPWSTSARKKS